MSVTKKKSTKRDRGLEKLIFFKFFIQIVLIYIKGFFKNANGLIAPFQLWDLQKPSSYTLVMRCPQVIFVSLRFTLVQNCINWDVRKIMSSGFTSFKLSRKTHQLEFFQ